MCKIIKYELRLGGKPVRLSEGDQIVHAGFDAYKRICVWIHTQNTGPVIYDRKIKVVATLESFESNYHHLHTIVDYYSEIDYHVLVRNEMWEEK